MKVDFRIIPNREAEAIRWRDGIPVILPVVEQVRDIARRRGPVRLSSRAT